MLAIFDLAKQAERNKWLTSLERLRATASASSEAGDAVAQIVADVARDGDQAVARYMRKWTDPDFSAERIAVTPQQIADAQRSLAPDLREAISTAIDHVRKYQQHIMPVAPKPITIDGAELGLRFLPVDSVGLTVPGGEAVLFSTLIMLAVPALVAGVTAENISVVSPPPTRKGDAPAGDISPIVLATCGLLGIKKVYRIGGAQGVAALAHGSESVEPVDLIAGPGNIFVQLAKAQVAGVCGNDGGFYGPSEIVTIADQYANPARVAADLIAQAEHNPGKCFLIAWSRAVIDDVLKQVDAQLAQRDRRMVIESALRDESCALLVDDEAAAVQVANTIAAEHVNLAVTDPDSMLEKIRHGGEVFLGDQTPVAAGDYYAGPSHCLPTGTTARFASGLSVYNFLRRAGTVHYRQGRSAKTVDHIARLAEAEGLDAHAASVRVRR